MRLRTLLIAILTLVMALAGAARGVSEDDDSFGARLKRIFAGHTPTPTPTPKKKPAQKKSLSETSPSPAASPLQSSPSPAEATEGAALPETAATAVPAPSDNLESNSPVPVETLATPAQVESSPTEKSRTSHDAQKQYFEPVRPISPPPGSHRMARPTAPERRPTPSQETGAAPETSPPKAAESASGKKANATTSTIAASEIVDYDNDPVDVRKIIDLSVGLTTQNLHYKYNSASPANGGMDSSGFIYYVLSKAGIKDVPRDAREQYVWARKAGNFQAVLSQREDTFELDALKPGDLLFWANSYGVSRDPDVTHTMIYLGREKGRNQRIMVGSSDGWRFKGEQRNGVSVLDFKVGRAKNAKSDEPGPTFVGYAKIPGLTTD